MAQGEEEEGLFALLLIVLEWTQPGRPSPLRPICDPRVLNHFIKEARDGENAVAVREANRTLCVVLCFRSAQRLCREGCSLSESVTVPQTSVDFDVWERKTAEVQAQEVQSGLWLLHRALSLLRSSVTDATLQGHIDNSIRNLLDTNGVLRSLNFQDYVPTASGPGGEETWRVSTAPELLHVYVNFLRGKVHLLLSGAQACQQDVS
ncbi:Erythropoietin [Merluccius polli]|uniref:Erythropoietin n=1 Tax=Merluccius polli TaxID=89951 RepID=A0AA47M519_MERPO|nr:Erythropoietin [Merluccius polli]